MSQQLQLPDEATAQSLVVDVHKRAFFGRLKQLGIVPSNEKEAKAVLDFGYELYMHEPQEPQSKAAAVSTYGTGKFASALAKFRKASSSIAPGFEKEAVENDWGAVPSSATLSQALVDQAYNAAYNLATDPRYYGAAVVKRAMVERDFASQA